MAKVVIMRGPSGSGKSTYTAKNYADATIVSADQFFFNEYGRYDFKPYLLSQAHADCQSRFIKALSERQEVIVVDNTSITNWEYQNYIDTARLVDYDVEIVEFIVEGEKAIKKIADRNTHGVPFEIVERMVDNFQPHTEETENIKVVDRIKV